MNRILKPAIMLLFVLFGSTTARAQTTYYVSTTGDDSKDGKTNATALATISAAIGKTVANDDIVILSGTYTFTALAGDVSKDITISGEGSTNTILQCSGSGYYLIKLSAAGATLKDLKITKTDKNGPHNLVYIGASNTTVQDCVIEGQFDIGDSEVSRAMEIAGGISGLLITGNTISDLRQPAYINAAAGTISNNHVAGTKGWVLADANMTFSGNTWGTGADANYYDIAILSGTTATYYPDIVALGLSNNGAVIEDQRPTSAVLNRVFVDASSTTGTENGSVIDPYTTIAPALSRVVSGGAVEVSSGTYSENPSVSKSLTIRGTELSGSSSGAAVVHGEISVSADNVTIKALKLTNPSGTGCITSNGNSYLTIQDNLFEDVGSSSLSGATHAIAVTSSTSPAVNITDITIKDNVFTGIHGGEDPSLSGINAKNNNGSGTAIGIGWSNANFTVSNILIEGNTISDVNGCTNVWTEGGKGAYGIIINVGASSTGQAPAPQVKDNTITDLEGLWAHAIGLEGDTPNALVEWNDISDLTDYKTPSDAIGVFVEDNPNSNLTIQYNTFGPNLPFGVARASGLSGTITVNATKNYWNDSSGPLHSSNPNGNGAAVSDDVTYSPWLAVVPGTTPMTWGTNDDIGNAINAASAGDIVEVVPGTYTENVSINVANLTLRSTDGRDNTIITPPTVGLETAGISVVSGMGAVTVDGFTTDGFRNGITQGMSQSSGTAFIVKNCKVIPENNSTTPYLRNGIQVSGDNSQVIGNYVVGAPLTSTWASSGIGVVNANNVLVEGNTINTAAADIGISIMNWDVAAISGFEVVNNTVLGAGNAVRISGYTSTSSPAVVKDVHITDNILKDSPSSSGINVQTVTLEDLSVIDNEITGHDFAGVRISSSSAVLAGTITLHGNNLSGNGSYGVYNGTADNASVTSWTIDAENNWWGSNDGPEDLLPASGGTEVPTSPEPTVQNMVNAVGTLGNAVNEYIDYFPWSTQANITQTGQDYDFDGSGDGTDDVTMNFSILPPGGGFVTVNWYGYVPSHAAALPQGALNNIFLEITSDLPNYQFEVTITLSALPSGFGSNTKVHFYNTASNRWMLIGGVFDDKGDSDPSNDTFTFTVNHFTQFSFVNTPSTPLVLKIDDGIVSDQFDESSLPDLSPSSIGWQDWMGMGDLTDDWSWEHQVFSVAVRPEYSGTGTADVFASSITLQYDPTDWSLNTSTGTTGTGVGTIFGSYNTIHQAQEGTAGTDNTITADISIQEAGNPEGTVDNSKTLTTFALTALGGFPSPIVFNNAHVRNNLNEAYSLDFSDDGRSRIYLGDVVETTGTPPSATFDHSTGDGAVDVGDLTVWSLAYFTDVSGVSYPGSLGSYKLKYDLGPTTTNYIDGLPQPDGKINFEDLVIFAISYGLDANNSYPKAPVQEHAVAIELGAPVAQGKRTLQPVMLRGEVTDVRALSLQFDLPANASLANVHAGALLAQDGFLKFNRDGNSVTVDMARLGASLTEEGVLCMLELEDGKAMLSNALARDSRNRPVEVTGATAALPNGVTLAQNYPNPFNPSTSIRFTLDDAAQVRLEVYSALGQHVATLLDASRGAGAHTVQWNGRDDSGSKVASGMYIYRLTAGETVLQKTMLLSK